MHKAKGMQWQPVHSSIDWDRCINIKTGSVCGPTEILKACLGVGCMAKDAPVHYWRTWMASLIAMHNSCVHWCRSTVSIRLEVSAGGISMN